MTYSGFKWSGRPDSNRGPRAPKARALTKLRYAPRRRLLRATGYYAVLRGYRVAVGDGSRLQRPGVFVAASRVDGALVRAIACVLW